ncbi:MAG: DNRLRE domain-containing protein [Methylophilaceae bacterium]
MKTRIVNMAGFTLLPVVLAMSLIAAIAFLLNRDNGMNINMVSVQTDTDRARYAAEAGLQAVNAKIQSLGCTGGYPVAGAPVTNNNFGGAGYTAYASTSSGNTTNLVSTGTYNNISIKLTRNNIYVYQLSPNTYTFQPDATTGIDTYIDSTIESNFGTSNLLPVKKNQQNLLYKFDLSTTLPIGSRPLSAIFSIYGSGGLLNGVDFYRVTSAWVEGTGISNPLDGATWNTSNGSTPWTPGGSHHPARLNATNKGTLPNSWVDFDATDITASWLTGQYPNNGVLIKSTGDLGIFKYASSDDSNITNHPKIVFNYLVPCGSTGPVDPPPITTATLSPTADSFNDSGALQSNNGVANTIKIYYTPIQENRILIKFDTSSIPTGSTVQSATLRMYVSAIGSATANTKSIWANAINESWVEGAGNNTNKTCPTVTAGTSWSYKTGCSGWAANIHPPFTAQSYTNNAGMNIPTARTNHMVATVNNKIYVIGGYHPVNGYFNKVEEYDPATNTWATKANMPTARSDAATAVVNGKIYVFGGTKDGASSLNVNEVYDPISDTWATKKVMTTGRMFMAGAVVNNKIYTIGGATTAYPFLIPLKTNEVYDPATDTWAVKANMTTARTYLSAQAVVGKIYAIGGYTGSLSLTNNEAYDTTANTWATKAALPVGTHFMGSATLGNKIYLLGGMRGSFATNAVLMFDTLNNAYKTQLNYPIANGAPAAVSLNGYIYSLGGDDGVSVVYTTHCRFDTGIPTPIATASDEATTASPLAAGFTSGWINFDLKPLLQEWVDGVRPNNGLVIYTEVADQFSINSRENSAKNPQLIIKY